MTTKLERFVTAKLLLELPTYLNAQISASDWKKIGLVVFRQRTIFFRSTKI